MCKREAAWYVGARRGGAWSTEMGGLTQQGGHFDNLDVTL